MSRTDIRRRCAVLVALLLALGVAPGCPKKDAAQSPQAATPGAPRPAREPAPALPPAKPQLLPGGHDAEQARQRIEQTLDRIDELVEQVRPRELTDAQRETLESVGNFSGLARQALGEGELERAGILAEKARILVEDVERESR
jgi:hypothetical protein